MSAVLGCSTRQKRTLGAVAVAAAVTATQSPARRHASLQLGEGGCDLRSYSGVILDEGNVGGE